MAYKIVFFDVDGTLLDQQNQIPEDTKQAVRQLQQKGIKVSLATGRSPYHSAGIAKELEIDTMVTFNGSLVIDKGEIIHSTPLQKDEMNLLQQLADQNNKPLVHLGAEVCYATELHPDVSETFRYLGLTPPPAQQDYWKNFDVYQAFLYCGADEEEQYRELVGRVTIHRWHPKVVDILPLHGSKARGIEALLRHYGISSTEAVAFGDGLNDKEMLQYVGMGVAMENANRELLPYANLVTYRMDQGGITFALQELGLID
ncbi:Cof-type HAD-IIB family hydrolase [Brevibacillus fulvus]|uniref:Cof subfamily protein (Haloacid dehalogenase superfamily) n=1 Tax=Brevibacillus fulvus TaxID=1125967 RepID=A0A938Y2C0_9BACL|nr:Cof-type HAD-IIB family hydrolase [Brevibacillus fulvus]MBM7591104.1 Cof subfamily protein (haloacid dehalogenase superfamily) [Brevibacillus fulvus]